jgi:endonuclease/exonuclease/phosphatase family metal-dependent hydrolase
VSGGHEALRIATWNLRSGLSVDRRSWWPARRARVAGVLGAVDADLWGFQEVFGFQRRWLARRGLPGEGWELAGEGRNRWRRGEAVPVACRSGRLRIVHQETCWFGPTPLRPGSVDPAAGSARVMTCVQALTVGARRIHVVNTHLDDASHEARRRAAKQVCGWLAGEPDLPVVVIGDLNATADDPELAPLFAAGLTSVLSAGAPPTATAFETEVGRRLDHLLVSHHWSVRSASVWTAAGAASDHYPVVADLELL